MLGLWVLARTVGPSPVRIYCKAAIPLHLCRSSFQRGSFTCLLIWSLSNPYGTGKSLSHRSQKRLETALLLSYKASSSRSVTCSALAPRSVLCTVHTHSNRAQRMTLQTQKDDSGASGEETKENEVFRLFNDTDKERLLHSLCLRSVPKSVLSKTKMNSKAIIVSLQVFKGFLKFLFHLISVCL